MDINTQHAIANAQKETAKPVATSERIQTIDVVRGVALLGILLINIEDFGIDWSVFYTISRGPHDTADYRTVQVIQVFFSGTMKGLFSMLFGAGVILFTMNKKETLGAVTIAELYYRRLLLLSTRPRWSPDGKKIVFHSTMDLQASESQEQGNEFEIYVMDADGSNVKRLTFNNVFDGHPDL